jgi:hypothetical protein
MELLRMATGVVDPLRPRKDFDDKMLKQKHQGIEKMYAKNLGHNTTNLVSFKEYKAASDRSPLINHLLVAMSEFMRHSIGGPEFWMARRK